ncbi:MAG: 1-deoxy-D-xylulose-5-phosphate reductoisomerase [Bryobacterales bacterium]|nr:1-deoxy-D-xylulose-5-phosphate reductoisomerase [Bryobacterales bacterium]
MRAVTLLGSTGSIGVSTLDILRRRPERFRPYALAAGRNAELLAQQIVEFRPHVAVVENDEIRNILIQALREKQLSQRDWPQLECGAKALVEVATARECDFVLSAIVGVAGLEATYEAVRARKQIGLANKEVLVASGELVMAAARDTGTELIPVDSEHNGAHQCFRAGRKQDVTRLILTASGGPFRNTPAGELKNVTPRQALKHPTWKMGQRITINSATMMNKGFEVIEACWLFALSPDEVEVVVHPQSSVHAMVEFNDGSVMAQLSTTDMRMPIQYALTYPERLDAPVARMNWLEARTLEFFPPDFEKFPQLRLAYEAQRGGGTSTCTLNAADEVAVEAFLNGQIPYTAMAEVVEDTLAKVPSRKAASVGEILEIDRESRRTAREVIKMRSTGAVTLTSGR